ncbi:hypothetical protein [Sphingobium subterraneum]|uniref:Lipoprotein n=1 Tax=Sphingobium subterraneum TaxID=627688 RepID=A0A841J0W6_9SPHN|nr:hypothetical protein [Sphingobium subterraneum]MBB6124280.1 hypothetical protein [Sphingobium subterraneum]
MIARRLVASLALFLAGCANMGNDGRGYPSLARRPIEGGAPVPQTAAPAPVVPTSVPSGTVADWQTQVPVLLRQAETGRAAFDSAYDGVAAQVRAATGAAISSETWVTANVGLGRLASERNGAVSALATLDTLYADRAKAIADGQLPIIGPGDPLADARSAALAIVDSENDRLDALRAMLKQP